MEGTKNRVAMGWAAQPFKNFDGWQVKSNGGERKSKVRSAWDLQVLSEAARGPTE